MKPIDLKTYCVLADAAVLAFSLPTVPWGFGTSRDLNQPSMVLVNGSRRTGTATSIFWLKSSTECTPNISDTRRVPKLAGVQVKGKRIKEEQR